MRKKKVSGGSTLRKPLVKWGWFFLGPVLLAFSIGFVWPFIQGIYLSFCEFRLISDTTFVGFENYIEVFKDGSFLHSFWYTALFAITSLVIINVLSFMVVTPSGMIIPLRLLHPPNAPLPIDVTLSGSMMLFRLAKLQNALEIEAFR